jgi:methyltransferase (TIGR00027 family)
MRDGASVTAALVAWYRGLARSLPPDARLVDDPFGLRFAGPIGRLVGARAVGAAALTVVPLLAEMILWLQLRTRALDDELADFVGAGGRQLVLLGAGFDCRAARLKALLEQTRVFEIDHPATQARKRAVLRAEPAAVTAYVPWDFERQPLAELGGRLGAVGHDAARPTLTLWEGVTMYLSEAANEATVAAVRAYSAPGSRFAFSYVEPRLLASRGPKQRLGRAFVRFVGEPFRFGWEPATLGPWLEARGFALARDERDAELAGRLLPPRFARRVSDDGRRIAFARRASDARG